MYSCLPQQQSRTIEKPMNQSYNRACTPEGESKFTKKSRTKTTTPVRQRNRLSYQRALQQLAKRILTTTTNRHSEFTSWSSCYCPKWVEGWGLEGGSVNRAYPYLCTCYYYGYCSGHHVPCRIPRLKITIPSQQLKKRALDNAIIRCTVVIECCRRRREIGGSTVKRSREKDNFPLYVLL